MTKEYRIAHHGGGVGTTSLWKMESWNEKKVESIQGMDSLGQRTGFVRGMWIGSNVRVDLGLSL